MYDLRYAPPQVAIHLHHLRDGWLVWPYKRVAYFAHDAAHGAIVDVGICAIQIAQRFRQSAFRRLEDEPTVVRMGACPRHSQTQFERHVETRRAGSVAVKLDAGKIMNRKRAAFDERCDAVQPAVACNAKRCPRQKSHCTQRRNVGKVESLKGFVVRNIDEDALLFRSWH